MPGDIQTALTALEECIKTTASERVLVEEIDDRLEELRAVYRRDKAGFEVGDLQRLWFASYIRDLAQDLMRVRMQLASVRDPRAYPGLECALAELEEGLRDTAVVARIRKEQADLAAKAPPMRATKADLEEARAVARDKETEARAEPCPQGHRMVLRQSKHGLFYGCSKYPACRATRDVEPE